MTICFLIKKDIKNVSSSNQLYMGCEILWINTKVDCTTCKPTINRLALPIRSEVVPRNGRFIHVRVEPVPTPCFISSSVEFLLCLFKKVAWPACRDLGWSNQDLGKRASPPSSSEASVRAAKPHGHKPLNGILSIWSRRQRTASRPYGFWE